MLPKDIIDILSKYQNEVAEEISSINLAIEKINSQLNTVNVVLMEELMVFAKNTGIRNKEKEIELLSDSQRIREYISSLTRIGYINHEESDKSYSGQTLFLDIHDIVVVSNTLKCSFGEHETIDVKADIPVLYETGEVFNLQTTISYCKQCKRYTMLKDDFKNISGIIMCQVLDETTILNSQNDDDIDIKQKESILYKYGYNVKGKRNLSDEQRHIILSSVIEAGILNRRQIADHLTTLIDRGSKIPKWEYATKKWKRDRQYV